MNKRIAALSVALVVASPLAYAASPSAGFKIESNITLALAEEAAKEAVANCATKGYQVAATVVDKAGDVKAMFRADGAGLPIRAGSIAIGAIGVGGAPGGPLDDQCAQAGIDKIKDRLRN